MLRKIFLPSIFILLAYGFWISPDSKEIAAGVAIFLFGMFYLEEGFRAFTGGTLEKILRRCTDRLWKSISFGIATTTLMQSSSLVSVITISFLSAALIELPGGIGIIFGANIGTTTGAWLVAGFGLKVKISAYAMTMLVFGCILTFQKRKALKGGGYILAGLGFLFLGIHHMKEGFETFKDSIDLVQYAVPGLLGLLIFTTIGVFATVVMQSSHATLVIIITALAAEQITYENALALAIGANIGTTITAIIGAINSNINGRRLAGGHLIFNLITGIIAIACIRYFIIAVDGISRFCHIAADDYSLKLALFHSMFNVVGVAVMLPFVGPLVRLLQFLLPEKNGSTIQPRYLNDAVTEFPDTILEAVRKETLYLYDNAFEIIAHGINLHRHDILSGKDMRAIVHAERKIFDIDIDQRYEATVKVLYAAIIAFISRAQERITHTYAEELYALRNAGRNIVEATKDVKHMRKNLQAFMVADNRHIREEYDTLRYWLGTVLRDIARQRHQDATDDPVTLSFLSALKVRLRENDVLASGRLDRLIRNSQITAEMGTSLMNDNAYMYAIASNLIQMAEVLFGTREQRRRETEKEFELSDGEQQALRQHRSAQALHALDDKMPG